MSIYLDASVIIPTFIPELHSALVDRFLDRHLDPYVVSDFAAGEVASGFSRLLREGKLGREAADRKLANFDGWLLTDCSHTTVGNADIRLAMVFVRRFDLKLRMPDALHLAVCRKLSLQLVTLDRRMADAGRALDIDVIIPD